MKHVIALSGKRLSGKDSVGNGLPFLTVKFATEIYNELTRLGFSDDQVAEHKEILRPIMLAVGDARRFFDPDHYAKIGIEECRNSGADKMVITDLRFQNEAKLLRLLGKETGWKVTLVRIERPDFLRDTVADQHISETDLDRWENWDMIVSAKSGEMKKLSAAAAALARIVE